MIFLLGNLVLELLHIVLLGEDSFHQEQRLLRTLERMTTARFVEKHAFTEIHINYLFIMFIHSTNKYELPAQTWIPDIILSLTHRHR